MRTYGQYCAMARALDVVGDRWTLMIIRELWLRPCRFGDLTGLLPGAATNLLSERLRSLTAAGVVARSAGPPALYSLTERGLALAPVMVELTRWGEAEMEREPGPDSYRNDWFGQAVEILVPSAAVTEPIVFELNFDGGGRPAMLVAAPGQGVRATRDEEAGSLTPQATISGDPVAMVALLAGRGAATALHVSGDRAVAGRLRAMLTKAAELKAATAP